MLNYNINNNNILQFFNYLHSDSDVGLPVQADERHDKQREFFGQEDKN